jgi:RHS repeat-associated protein
MLETVTETTTKSHTFPPYLYDGNLLLAETDNADKIQKVYINDGQGIIGMVRYIYKDDGTFSHYQSLYYMYDSLGSVSLVAGEDGKPLQNYKYTPYGALINVESDPINGLRFVGRYSGYQDDDTNLIYFWHRWYDGRNGRWVSRDAHPSKCLFVVNLYNYAKNLPNLFIDKTGYYQESPNKPGAPPTGGDAYGNWCGGDRSGGYSSIANKGGYNYGVYDAAPVDNLDSCCKEHDRCLTLADLRKNLGLLSKCQTNEDKRKCNGDLVNCAIGTLGTSNNNFYNLGLIMVFGISETNPFIPGGGVSY